MENVSIIIGHFLKQLIFAFLFILFAQSAIAQKNNVKVGINPSGKLNLEYERTLSNKTSLIVGYKFIWTSDYFVKNGGLFDPKKAENKGHRVVALYRMYLTSPEKQMDGLYLAPGVSFGRHQITYQREDGLGHYYWFGVERTYTEYAVGEEELYGAGLGLKLGYQKRWKRFNIDIGTNLLRNIVLGDKQGVTLDNGQFIAFEKDVNGFTPEVYLGIGFAF